MIASTREKPKKVLVITDSFPPEVVGGAELSLYNVLCKLNRNDKELVIASLSGRVSRLELQEYGGFKVYRVPFQEEWPKYTASARRSVRYLGFLKELLSHGTDAVKLARAIATNVILHKKHPRSLGIFPLVDRFYLLRSKTVKHLNQVVRLEDPKVIHADNYRSIILASHFHSRIPTVSMVRDNRFFCAHRNQATNIGGKICAECSFGCTVGKASPWIERWARNLMADTRQLRQRALATSDCVGVTSDFLRKQLEIFLPAEKIHIIPNITEEPSQIADWTKGVERSFPPRILCVGMIGHNKGQRLLLQAFADIIKRQSDCRLVFAGRGAMIESLRREAQAMRIDQQVEFIGFLDRPDLLREVARASVVACPNVWPEPFGRVPLEAALAKRPIVAFSSGAMGENITHGVTGMLVEPQNIEQLAYSLLQILEEPGLGRAMGERAYQKITARHQKADPHEKLSDVWAGVTSE